MRKIAAALCLLFLFGCASQQDAQLPALGNTSIPSPANATVLQNSQPMPAATPANAASNETPMQAQGLPVVEYYFSPLCGHCDAIKPSIDELEANFSGKVQFRRINVLTSNGFAQFDSMANRTNLSQRVVPLIVYNYTVLVGADEINQSLNGLLLNLSG